MTLTTYNMNLQYQRTELEYEMRISKVTPAQKEQELLEKSAKGLEASNLPVVYMDESNLSSSELLRKFILEATIFQRSSSESIGLFPYGNKKVSHDPTEFKNPYEQETLPHSFVYAAREEYYEKTTIDFEGEIRIVTPEGEYNVKLNFSYTQEFYEKNETIVQMTQEQFKKPLEVQMDKDDQRFKELKSIHFFFEMIKHEEGRAEREEALEAIRETKEKRLEHLEDKKENLLPVEQNFNVWASENRSEFSLVALKQGDLEVFFANSFRETSYVNVQKSDDGYSVSAGYSSVESSYLEVEA